MAKKKKPFDKRVKPLNETVLHGGFVFMQKDFYGPHYKKYKLVLVFKGSLPIVAATAMSIVVRMGRRQKQISWNGVEETLSAVELIRKGMILYKEDKNHLKNTERETPTAGVDIPPNEKYVIDRIFEHLNENME